MGKAKVVRRENKKLGVELQAARATKNTAWEQEILAKFARQEKSDRQVAAIRDLTEKKRAAKKTSDSAGINEDDAGAEVEDSLEADREIETEQDEHMSAEEASTGSLATTSGAVEGSNSNGDAEYRRGQATVELVLESVPVLTEEQIRHKAKLRKRKEKRQAIQKANEDWKKAQKKGKGKKTRRDAGIKQEQN
ncbi:unnamed protein product [Zymoseptoria tritici ST99CH_1A5]|uniref:Uncharacterized protein n=3 Tax=Zymoseptoria tritici TaxID=1047171 RepID=A0A1X7RRN6_ZYMT9|nr:unnamed protein product [Zymoseptoria tritici ST99CH_3D7]SMR50635.1 unnamed protein product [Zymoseptoria tritici ST99CH_1E4]SMY23336.1 unnamed protein product [Zymoseptoria tritici ST99CH_1A5]